MLYLCVVAEVGRVSQTGPSHLNVQVEVLLDALRPLMSLISMRPRYKLDGASTLHTTTSPTLPMQLLWFLAFTKS